MLKLYFSSNEWCTKMVAKIKGMILEEFPDANISVSAPTVNPKAYRPNWYVIITFEEMSTYKGKGLSYKIRNKCSNTVDFFVTS